MENSPGPADGGSDGGSPGPAPHPSAPGRPDEDESRGRGRGRAAPDGGSGDGAAGDGVTGEGMTGEGDTSDGARVEAAPDEGQDPRRDPLRFNSWRQRSATGAVMTGIAMGLQQALELPRQEPAFVIEAPGEPDDPDRPIDLRFDPDSPEDTVAVIRRPNPKGPRGEGSSPS